MKKLDELLIGAKCRLRQLIFGKQPGIDGIIVVIVLVIIAVAILAVVGAKFQSISNDAMTKTESEIAKLWGSTSAGP